MEVRERSSLKLIEPIPDDDHKKPKEENYDHHHLQVEEKDKSSAGETINQKEENYDHHHLIAEC